MRKLTRKYGVILAFLILMLVVLACNVLTPSSSVDTAPTQQVIASPSNTNDGPPLTEAGVLRISVEEAKVAFDSGEAVIVDVRSQGAYEARHVAGALFITLGEFEVNIADIPLDKDQWIITYCT